MPANFLRTTDGTGVLFGVGLTISTATVIMQEVESTRDAKEATAVGPDGDEIAVVVYGGKMTNVRGSYIFKGNDIGAIGDNLLSKLTGSLLNTTDAVLMSGFTRKRSNEGFCEGTFKAVSLSGVSAVTS